jgi:hypothetical protein
VLRNFLSTIGISEQKINFLVALWKQSSDVKKV